MWRQLCALIIACTLFTGCYTTHRFPAAPIPVRLVSGSEFQLALSATGSEAASTCAVQRAEIEVAALRNDTLHFSRVRVLKQRQGAAACAHEGAGFVALAEHPELRAERVAVNGALTWSAILFVALPVAITALILLACSISFCYYT